MRLVVFGATGVTGRLVVDQALVAGHEVVAYARTPGKLAPRERLSVVEGTLADAEAISVAISGADAAISLLGPGRDAAGIDQLLTGVGHIVAGMREHNVARLVAVATPSSSDPTDPWDLRIDVMVAAVRLLLRPAYDAIVGLGALVRTSGLAWTLVRVPLLTDGPAGTISIRRAGQRAGLRLSRSGLAGYLLARAQDTTEAHQAPLISDH